MLTLHHHPHSRAATVVWMLEEVGEPYSLEFVDLRAGQHKEDGFLKLNHMGKLPTLVDRSGQGEVVVTEAAAIALYLGDRYALGRLAPAPDAPERSAYYRWSFYAPSVIEPGCMAKASGWEVKDGQAGWGRYESMLDTIGAAIGEGPWLLGETFSMADIVFGGTLAWMLMFDMIEARPEFSAYTERLLARPAQQRAQEINARVAKEHGLG